MSRVIAGVVRIDAVYSDVGSPRATGRDALPPPATGYLNLQLSSFEGAATPHAFGRHAIVFSASPSLAVSAQRGACRPLLLPGRRFGQILSRRGSESETAPLIQVVERKLYDRMLTTGPTKARRQLSVQILLGAPALLRHHVLPVLATYGFQSHMALLSLPRLLSDAYP